MLTESFFSFLFPDSFRDRYMQSSENIESIQDSSAEVFRREFEFKKTLI